MFCRQILMYRDEYINGNLDPDEITRFNEHLKNCPDCKEIIEQEKKLQSLLKSSISPDPGENYWHNLETSILSRITKTIDDQSENSSSRDYKPVNIIYRYLIPVAVSILLLAGSITSLDYSTTAVTALEAKNQPAKTEPYVEYQFNPELFGAIILGPPGSFGRRLTLMVNINKTGMGNR